MARLWRTDGKTILERSIGENKRFIACVFHVEFVHGGSLKPICELSDVKHEKVGALERDECTFVVIARHFGRFGRFCRTEAAVQFPH